MGAILAGAEEAPDASSMARPSQPEHHINLHNHFLMATAQLYTQGKLALGLPIAHTPVTRK
jgi:hypothetical protein